MAKFMYLFRNDQSRIKTLSPEQMQQQMQRWMGWMDSLTREGHLVTRGERLSTRHALVRSTGISDGPYTEAKDMIGGFMTIEAESFEQAVELSRACPVLADGGAVEVRPVIGM